MGNIKKESLVNIWQSEKFKKIRKSLLNNNRENLNLCKVCDFYGIKVRDNTPFLQKFIYKVTV